MTHIPLAQTHTDIDVEFLRDLEGGVILKGYWDTHALNGVRIATGIDLGKRDFYELKSLGVPLPLCTKLKPYYGLRGKKALWCLEGHPLVITPEEADLLDQPFLDKVYTCVSNQYNQALRNYNRTTQPVWSELPREVRTVIVSLAFSIEHLINHASRAWHFVVTNQWDMLQRELNNFGRPKNAQRVRRAREALHLETLLGKNDTTPIPENYPWPETVLMRVADNAGDRKLNASRGKKRKGRRQEYLEERRKAEYTKRGLPPV